MNLLKNEIFYKKLVYLLNNNLVLNKDVESIVKDTNDISESFKNGYYNKKLRCCPGLLQFTRHR